MISDLAPVDLLIQRAGRLHRHIRDKQGNINNVSDTIDERGKPRFYVYSPEFTEQPETSWLATGFTGTAAVYQNIGILWLTLKIIDTKKGWNMPCDARTLIESVYGDQAKQNIPESLLPKVGKAENADRKKESMGNLNALALEKGYCRDAAPADQWDEDEAVSTRLSDETIEIFLAVVRNGQILPYANAIDYPWDMSVLSVSWWDWKNSGYVFPAQHTALVEQLKKENPRLKYSEIVIVEKRSNEAVLAQEPISASYSPRLGWGAAITQEVK